jgi:hypothetical protein
MASHLKRKKKAKATEPVLSKTMQEAFARFLEHHPVKRLSKNLRRILMEHLMQNEAGQSIYLYETLKDLHGLFELLDMAEEEWNPSSHN